MLVDSHEEKSCFESKRTYIYYAGVMVVVVLPTQQQSTASRKGFLEIYKKLAVGRPRDLLVSTGTTVGRFRKYM